jgi:DNA-binding MarR family transcriptional regulator
MVPYCSSVSTPPPSVALDDQLCFALYAASRAVTARYRPMLDRLGLTYPQLLVLMTLWEQDDRTVRQLSDRLELDSGTMSPMLKRLEAAGLVTRRRSTTDERQVRVRLTEAGRELRQPACGVSAGMIEALDLDVREFAALKRRLEEIARRVSGRDGAGQAPDRRPSPDPATPAGPGDDPGVSPG